MKLAIQWHSLYKHKYKKCVVFYDFLHKSDICNDPKKYLKSYGFTTKCVLILIIVHLLSMLVTLKIQDPNLTEVIILTKMEYLLGSCNSPDKSAVYCWNYNTGNVEHLYRSKHKSVRNSLCILSNNYILTAEEDKPLLHLWPINRQETKTRLVLPGSAEAVCIDSSSTYLMVGIATRVYIWLIGSGELLNVLEKNYQPVSCIKVSKTTEYLVIAGKDGFLTTYKCNDAMTRSLMGQCEPLYTRTDHTDAITDIDIGSFGSMSRVISVSLDKTCRVYGLNNGDPLKILIFNYRLSSVIMDVTGWNIYIGDSRGTINLVQLENSSLTQHVEEDVACFKGHSDRIVSMDINMSHNVLATASDDCSIIIWDLKTQKLLRRIKQGLPPTSVHFYGAHSNMNSKVFKPRIVLKPLKKSIVADMADVELSIVQNKDIEFEDNIKFDIENVGSISGVNDNLRIVNKQLHDLITVLIKDKTGK